MPKVFISYRRDDSAYATHAIYKHLADHYGSDSVVFDVDSIPLGIDFVEYLSEQVSQCDALLAIIGSGWVDARSEDGTRRLDDPDDFVQIEIHSALKLGIPVIPVLVDRTSMPKADDLPPSLKPLSRRNAAEVRPGRDYQSHLELLVRGLDRVFQRAAATSREKGDAATPEKRQESTEPKAAVIRLICPGCGKGYVVPESEIGKRAKCRECGHSFKVAKSIGSHKGFDGNTREATSDAEHEPPVAPSRHAPALPKSPETAKKTEVRISPGAIESVEVITNSIGMQLKLIPAGKFMIGSPATETAARDNENHQHLVSITQYFLMGIYAVTQGQFEKVMGTSPWRGQGYVKEGPDYPAVCVNWSQAVEFCRKLSGLEGVEYRLPTEAQWEYACRAGTTTAYSFGDDASQLGQYAWYGENAWGIGEQYAHPVGQKLPNPWGLYDMHGNVWEWCRDWYGQYGDAEVTDPSGPASGSSRVLRGGSFIYGAVYCRSAFRDWTDPEDRDLSFGFRVSRTYS